jgi:CheY-like chemotaxis protein
MKEFSLAGKVILVAEDVLFSREIIVRMLRSMGHPEVHQATNGKEAIDIIRDVKHVDLIITDFKMPEINGLDLLKVLRTGKTELPRDVPVGMLTGFSDSYLVDMALALDVNAFLIKPVSKDAMSQRLEKMLHGPSDKSWLRSIELYKALDVGQVESDPDESKKKTSEYRKTASSSENKSGPKLTADKSQIVRRRSSQRGKFEDSDLAKDVTHGESQLASEIGKKQTAQIMSVFDRLDHSGEFSLEDLAACFSATTKGSHATSSHKKAQKLPASATPSMKKVFSQAKKLPQNGVIAEDVKSTEGHVLINAGTRMSSTLAAIVSHLENLGVLSLRANPNNPDERGFDVLADEGDEESIDFGEPEGQKFRLDGEELRVSPNDLVDGDIVTRNVYTTDGRLYLHAGTEVGPRVNAILRDLHVLKNINSDIWILERLPANAK